MSFIIQRVFLDLRRISSDAGMGWETIMGCRQFFYVRSVFPLPYPLHGVALPCWTDIIALVSWRYTGIGHLILSETCDARIDVDSHRR